MKDIKEIKLIVASFFIILGVFAEQPAVSSPPKKVKNIIFMIGDGMGTTQIYAALTANKDWLHLEKIKHIGFAKTNSSNRYITDSAAGATAYSTGKKTKNGAVGVDSLDRPVPTILEIAHQNGLSTGLVATTDITDATPAAFVAHVPTRKMQQEIAADYLKSGVDVFIGAGRSHFVNREDGRNLVEELIQKGYKVSYDIDEIVNIKDGKIAGLLSERRAAERGDQLTRSAFSAIHNLNQNPKGFFLMIEGSKIDDGGHGNDLDVVIDEMLDFDRAIGKVLEFAEKDGETLVVITADHETGGLTLTSGDLNTGRVEGQFSTKGHTSVMVPVFAFGPGAEEFMGIYHNHTIFEKLMNAFQLQK